ncbi:MAG: RDD family protein [Chitinophagales bacterium]|nr:RDD family protein [Chitinophagales bacterium]
MENTILDREVAQSQNVVYAGFWERTAATLIDCLVMVPVIIINVINAMNWKSFIVSLVLGLTWIMYKVYLEGTRGNTIGKKAMHIRIVDADLNTINMQNQLQEIACILSMLFLVW